METIIAWAATHPILAWSGGLAALIILLALAYGVFVLWVLWDSIDRSGAKLMPEILAVRHDAEDVLVFTWSIRSVGKFAARDVHVWMSITARQKTGHSAAWRFHSKVATLETGTCTDFDIRVSRSELARLAHDFNHGRISLSTHYSSSSPKKRLKPMGVMGPQVHYALAVAEVSGKASVTVTDFTPIDPYHT
jgi:hypothetical protein